MLNNHLNSLWKTVIDPKLAKKENNNWYLNNKSSYGSTKFIGKRILFGYVISCVGSISAWYLVPIWGYWISSLIDLTFFIIPYILFFILYRKTPKLGDELYVREEMKYVNLCVIGSLCGYIIIVVISLFFDSKYQPLFVIFLCFSAATWLFLACFFHTKWVLSHLKIWLNKSCENVPDLDNLPSRYQSVLSNIKQIRTENKISNTNTETSKRSTINLSSFENGSRMESMRDYLKTNIYVNDVFQNEETFNGFAIHLNKEFSMECLLSFIEMMQFKSYIYKNIQNSKLKRTVNENDMVGMLQDVKFIDFEDYVPKSQIVYSNEEECNLQIIKQKAYYLYCKYIDEGLCVSPLFHLFISIQCTFIHFTLDNK